MLNLMIINIKKILLMRMYWFLIAQFRKLLQIKVLILLRVRINKAAIITNRDIILLTKKKQLSIIRLKGL